jgi:HPt (histidine-containing phosphotransfer) domain-containing protein
MNFKELGESLGLEEDEYRELVELFANTGAADFEKIESGLASSDADTVMRSAHTIKGAASNLGFADLSDTAKIIEESASNNRLEGLDQAVSTLKTQLEAITAFVSD